MVFHKQDGALYVLHRGRIWILRSQTIVDSKPRVAGRGERVEQRQHKIDRLVAGRPAATMHQDHRGKRAFAGGMCASPLGYRMLGELDVFANGILGCRGKVVPRNLTGHTKERDKIPNHRYVLDQSYTSGDRMGVPLFESRMGRPLGVR